MFPPPAFSLCERNQWTFTGLGTAVYQPALRPDQITRPYYLKLQRRKPMTRLLREAVEQYLQVYVEELEQLVKETEANFPRCKR